jgi:hypothetical protein
MAVLSVKADNIPVRKRILNFPPYHRWVFSERPASWVAGYGLSLRHERIKALGKHSRRDG